MGLPSISKSLDENIDLTTFFWSWTKAPSAKRDNRKNPKINLYLHQVETWISNYSQMGINNPHPENQTIQKNPKKKKKKILKNKKKTKKFFFN